MQVHQGERLEPRRLPARTMPGVLQAVVREAGSRLFLRVIDPKQPDAPPLELTYGQFGEQVRQAAAWLRAAGLGAGGRLLLLAENSPAWQAFSLAAQALRAEPSALFANLDALPAQDAALRVRPVAIFVSTAAQWSKLAPAADALVQAGLRAVISAEPLPAPPAGLRVTTAQEALSSAPLPEAEFAALVEAVGEKDPFLLLFTSGTSGRPKGVRVHQAAFAHAVDAGCALIQAEPDDWSLGFLPYAHIAGQCVFYAALGRPHGLIHVARRDDLPRGFALGPTYVLSVPLIYERMLQAVEQSIEERPAPLRALLRAALQAAVRQRCRGSRALRDRALGAVARALVGKKLRARLGGRMRAVAGGGAPTPPALFEFFESMDLPYCDIYGMSETAGFIATNTLARPRRAGAAGVPSTDVELRLSDDGEVQVRGGTLMAGYLDKEDDAPAFTDDGWFRTGDLGAFDAQGDLRVVGRKKALLVLSTGKKISPEPLELAAAASSPIAGAVLCGDGQPFVSMAVFVPGEQLSRLRAQHGDAERALLEIIHGRLGQFSEYERPKRLFAIEGTPQDYPEILTPTLKVKRDVFAQWQAKELERIYAA